jgi:hypothetical protein
MYSVANNGFSPVGLPHSAIRGSMDICSYPRLFAAYHGLLRLATPRHPPMDPYSLDHIIVPEFSPTAKPLGVLFHKTPSVFPPLAKTQPGLLLIVLPFVLSNIISCLKTLPHLLTICSRRLRFRGDKGIRTPDLRLAKPPL